MCYIGGTGQLTAVAYKCLSKLNSNVTLYIDVCVGARATRAQPLRKLLYLGSSIKV